MNPIVVESLKKYYSSLKAVDGISFTVNQGEIFGLLGPNGAGKTTAVEILEGLRRRDAGKVEVLGLDPWKQGYELHKKIGVIPQDFNFFESTTPREAIVYYSNLFKSKVDPDEILREVLLEDSGKMQFQKLSGGQKQKMGLALSLVNTPELVFLDEPTTGLDPNARRAIWEVIKRLKASGKTILLTTHYLDEAQQLSDKVAIMNHGHIVAYGTSDEIIAEFGSGERLEFNGSNSKLADYIRDKTKLQVDFDETRSTVSVLMKEKADALKALKATEESGLDYSEMKTHRDSLDDVFIKLVNMQINSQGEIQENNNGNKPKNKGRKK